MRMGIFTEIDEGIEAAEEIKRGEAVTTERRAKILQAITALHQMPFSELRAKLIAALNR
jgi:hypothetical protein